MDLNLFGFSPCDFSITWQKHGTPCNIWQRSHDCVALILLTKKKKHFQTFFLLHFQPSLLIFFTFPLLSFKTPPPKNAPYCEQTGCFCGRAALVASLPLTASRQQGGPSLAARRFVFCRDLFFFSVLFCFVFFVAVVFHFEGCGGNSRCVKKQRTQTAFQRETGSVWHFLSVLRMVPRLPVWRDFRGLVETPGGSFVVQTHCLLSPSKCQIFFFLFFFKFHELLPAWRHGAWGQAAISHTLRRSSCPGLPDLHQPWSTVFATRLQNPPSGVSSNPNMD